MNMIEGNDDNDDARGEDDAHKQKDRESNLREMDGTVTWRVT